MQSLVKLFECDVEGEDDEENHLAELETKGDFIKLVENSFAVCKEGVGGKKVVRGVLLLDCSGLDRRKRFP